VPRGLEKTAPSFRSFASGRYVVRRLLGEGGQKTVFLGRDTQLDRDVAIALLKTEGLDEASVARVRKEARTMAGLGAQPHIVTIFDIGEEEARPYIVSEYVPGGELRQELARGGRPLPLERALAITKDLCRALAFAHSQGIVHRDVKPDNVWLARDGTAKLGDFGLALGTDRSRLTMAGTVMGTAAYMAPEQAAGTEVDGRTDLYSLGCLLYEALSGRPPFVGDNALAVISQHARVPPARPSDYNPAVPRGLDRLTLQLLAKAKEDRPASAEQALAELERVAAECLQQPARLDEARGREQG